MNVVTIPKKLAQRDDLVVIPRGEYEDLLELKKIIPMVKATKAELRAIRRGEREIARGEYVTWRELKYDLACTRNRKR